MVGAFQTEDWREACTVYVCRLPVSRCERCSRPARYRLSTLGAIWRACDDHLPDLLAAAVAARLPTSDAAA